MGVELLKSSSEGSESILKTLWHHSDAIMCCSLKVCLELCNTSLSPSLSYLSFFLVVCNIKYEFLHWKSSVGLTPYQTEPIYF